jgi:RNA polymerase sigma-70 factor (ECF subfamily)
MKEKDLINSILNGNTTDYGYFIDTYQQMALTIALRICENRQEAEDVVQNAFVKAYYNLPSFQIKSKFSTWFYRIVYNLAINTTKKSVFYPLYVNYENIEENNITFSSQTFLEDLEREETKKKVEKTLDQLPKDLSLVMQLYYLNEKKVEEVAVIMGITKENVKIRLYRARKLFIKHWEQEKYRNNE